MPERRLERKEGEPKKRITVCNARLVWKSPGQFPDTHHFYVADERRELFIQADVERLATEMTKGIGPAALICAGGQEPEINYRAPEEAKVIWTVGYYRQPLLPAEVYALTNFTSEQIKELEACLIKQRSSNQLVRTSSTTGN